jgi:flagellar basal-body rod protein FlgF
MDSTIYKALSGAILQMRKLDLGSQDLANLNTSGYKAQRFAFGELLASDSPAGSRSGGFAAVAAQNTNMLQGQLETTGNPFHLAISGSGFFVIETPRGERYTRSGNFSITGAGTVVTPDGYPLLSDSGHIQVSGGKFEVGTDGNIRSEFGELGKLRIVRFTNPSRLVREGGSLFSSDTVNVEDEEAPTIIQRTLEQSNVNPIDGMVSLITTQRHYEAYERAMKLVDSVIQKVIADASR